MLEEEANELGGISEEQTSPPSDHDNGTQGESLKTGDSQPESLEADSAHSDSSGYDSEAASQADSGKSETLLCYIYSNPADHAWSITTT